jgi:hypothetical protein
MEQECQFELGQVCHAGIGLRVLEVQVVGGTIFLVLYRNSGRWRATSGAKLL